MRYAAIIAALILLAAPAAAHEFHPENLNSSTVDYYQEELNIYSDQAPEFLTSIVGNQTVNANIRYENGTDKQVAARLDGVKVTDMKMGSYENATLEVNTSVKQINNISTSEQPIKTLNSELKEGDIEYRSNGMLNSLRTFIAEQLLTIFG